MARKKAVAVATPVVEKATEQYQMNTQLVVGGEKLAIEEFTKLIRKGDDAHYFQIGLLIDLPAFVEEGKPIDNPRSKERWSILTRNTVAEELKLTHYSIIERDDGKVQITFHFDMLVEILKAGRVSDEPVEFRILEELKFYFGDLVIRGHWKLTHIDSGESIYGIAGKTGLIQEQTDAHDAVCEIYKHQAAYQAMIQEASNA